MVGMSTWFIWPCFLQPCMVFKNIGLQFISSKFKWFRGILAKLLTETVWFNCAQELKHAVALADDLYMSQYSDYDICYIAVLPVKNNS